MMGNLKIQRPSEGTRRLFSQDFDAEMDRFAIGSRFKSSDSTIMNDSMVFLVVADCDLLRSFTISVLERRGVPCRPVVRLQDTIALAEGGGYVGAVIFSNSASESSLDDTNVAETLATRFGLVVFMSDPDRDGLRIEPTTDQGILFRLPSPLRFKDFSLIVELYRVTNTINYSL